MFSLGCSATTGLLLLLLLGPAFSAPIGKNDRSLPKYLHCFLTEWIIFNSFSAGFLDREELFGLGGQDSQGEAEYGQLQLDSTSPARTGPHHLASIDTDHGNLA